ncbi:MAG: GNAT family N-acetyltransferase [Eubacteriales bacterium]|nr:GNAT family N-acetyltransferase [Eubacteriales bacterium]
MNRKYKESRKLWEEVFQEDTPEFLDYYDQCVADHNRIYGDEEKGEFVSMLHMNPYCVQAGKKTAQVSYIVAVATKKEFRHQGRMRKLLKKALTDSYENEEPFAFLMPASEAIYRPFGFRTVRWQDVIALGGPFQSKQNGGEISCRYAKKEQIPQLAAFSQQILERHCGVFTKRDTGYYERIWKEQEAVNGGILLLYHKEDLCGYCFTGQEDGNEIWELVVESRAEAPVSEKARDYAKAVQAVTDVFGESGPIKIRGLLPGAVVEGISPKEISWRPITMVRIVNLAAFAQLLRAKEEIELCLRVQDDLLEENSGCYRLCIDREGGRLTKLSDREYEKKSETIVPITVEELTDVFFGLHEMKGIPSSGLQILHPVYFNELV